MLIKRINNGHYSQLEDDKLKSLYTCLEELQLWQGENPFDVEAGIDYFSIFENRKFIEVELERVLKKHKEAYTSYEIANIIYEDKILKADIYFNIDSEKTYHFNLHISEDINNG